MKYIDLDNALKETGKARRKSQPPHLDYVTIDAGLHKWVRNDGKKDLLLYSEGVLRSWIPYNPNPDIVPTEAGELWLQQKAGSDYFEYYHTDVSLDGKFRIICYDGSNTSHRQNEMIHGANGWTRLFPVVKEDTKEKVLRKSFCIKVGWDYAGRKGLYLGEVFENQEWAIVVFDGEEDPSLYKKPALIIE